MALTCADLTVYYSLEEGAAATRVDAKIGNDLTQVNTVGNAAGVVGNAALFGTGTYLSRTSTADLNFPSNVVFSISLWFYLATTATQGLAWKGDTVSVLTDYGWRLNTSSTNILMAVTDGAGGHQGVCTTTATWSTNTWTHLAAWYDTTNLNVALNDGTPKTQAYTWGSWADTHNFSLGASGNGGSVISNGSMLDEVAIFNGYAFTAGDVTWLYNSGAGRSYSEICAGMVSTHDMRGGFHRGMRGGFLN